MVLVDSVLYVIQWNVQINSVRRTGDNVNDDNACFPLT